MSSTHSNGHDGLRMLITEPHDGHRDDERCPGCPHPATPTEENTCTCPPDDAPGSRDALGYQIARETCCVHGVNAPDSTPTEETAEVADEDREACCEHSLSWHHETRGCGYHGFAAGDRCPCLLTFDEALASHDAALTANARAERIEFHRELEKWESLAHSNGWQYDRAIVRADAAQAEADDLRARLAAVEAHQITFHEKITGLVWSCTCGATGAGARESVKRAANDHRASLANPDAPKGASYDE